MAEQRTQLGNVLRNAGRVEEAEQITRQAVELQEELVAEFPDVLEHQLTLSNHHNKLGLVLKQMGRMDETEEVFRQIAELRGKLVADFPDVPLYQHRLARYHNRLGSALSIAGRRQEAEQEQHLVVELYEKLIADFPDIHNDWVLLGNIYLRLRQWDKMASNYTQAISLNPGHHEHWKQRGRAYAELGQFEKAALDFSKGAELKPDRGYIWHRQALAQLGAGQMEEYRRTCADMLQRFGRAEDPISTHWIASTCVLVPEAVENLNHVIQLAEKAVEANDTIARLNTLGAVLYRAGRFDEAIQKLGGSTAYTSTWFFMAMTHYQLGHFDESRKWLDKAVEQAEQEIQDTRSWWKRRLTLQLLRREAELLMGKSEQTTPDGKEVVPGKEE